MFDDLPQFVPQEICLACDGCCRFKSPESCWRPRMAPEEVSEDAFTEEILKAELREDGRIGTVERGGQCQCAFFQGPDNICRIYAYRPFECRLYPFLLTKGEDGPAVSVHGNCPYVQQRRRGPEFKDYVAELREYCRRKNILEFVRKNPPLIGDYPQYDQEIGHLFTL